MAPRRAVAGFLDSRTLILVIVVAAAVAVLIPLIVGRSDQMQRMRVDLAEVLGECRARYDAARSLADTTAVDAWRPLLHGAERSGDPACGAYRRRNLLPVHTP